jgi:UDP-glucose 4-epimerase
MACILLTGATGYIASHTWLTLQAAGHEVVGVDNLCNSSPEVLERLRFISGSQPIFERADVSDAHALYGVFERHAIDAVVHFAALKAVGESTERPLEYYANNLGALMSLLATMERHAVRTLVFSSSATVYGVPQSLPISEDAPLSATNPYASTKLISETILRDLIKARPEWAVGVLRYFNPAGAHESGHIGENPKGIPNNVMPYITQVAVGRRERLRIFGNDYDTPDGTGVRDYVHVLDLAGGHTACLRYLLDVGSSLTVNLGTGRGHSVLELLRAFERACGRSIAHEFAPRRAGDVASCYAEVTRARELLGWQSHRDLDTMCADSWRWQQLNPDGYAQ